MAIKTDSGFTIIEVMLFLGVTGLLAVGILVGSGLAIGQQRYRDSVNSLKSFIQDQYSETSNVINSRPGNWSCDGSGAVGETAIGGGQPRGTSECVMLGRLVTINETGTEATVSNVVGYHVAGAVPAANDISELVDSYSIGISPIDQLTEQIRWSAQIVKPKTTTPMPMSILVIRSPLSGAVLTFTAEGVATNPKAIITSENLQQTRHLCVSANPGTFVGRRLEVRIQPFAANQGAIQIPPEGESVCD
jgi:type II secretory pathway pseudopilin PulG